ncbi:MAG: tRNA-dihydrouridine synthase family protein [Desulfovibrio sp.]|nr:tRNA-dihydrouridine synthase family protein [Desulfovibrio sp.]
MAKFRLPKASSCDKRLTFRADTPWLAPLAGYSDLPFRLLCRELGACVATTEMISAKGLCYESPGTLPLLQTTAADQPLVVQLFGAEADFLARAVAELVAAGFRYFDLNMGCSVPKVMRQKAGAALLAEPDKALACARAMIREAGPGCVGCKLRLGVNEKQNCLPDLALRLEEAGAAWITLHPRYAQQHFQGQADHAWLTRLHQKLSIPLIASGDLLSAQDGIRCLEECGVACVMYARGALKNPFIFRQHSLALQKKDGAADEQSLRWLLLRHLQLVEENPPSARDQTARMRGILSSYVRGQPFARAMRIAFCQARTWSELYAIVNAFLPQA